MAEELHFWKNGVCNFILFYVSENSGKLKFFIAGQGGSANFELGYFFFFFFLVLELGISGIAKTKNTNLAITRRIENTHHIADFFL